MDPTSSAPPPFQFPQTSSSFIAGQNGRVNLQDQPSAGGFLKNPAMGGFSHRTETDANSGSDLLRGNWQENSLSSTFFGPENTRLIQKSIKQAVYEKSGSKKWVIDDQSADELQIVMRSMFLQYAKNLDYDIPGQVQELNRLVVDWCEPRISSEIGMYEYYLKDISKMPIPLEHPVLLSSAGSKSLPFRKFM
jgi:hypothetical protein